MRKRPDWGVLLCFVFPFKRPLGRCYGAGEEEAQATCCCIAIRKLRWYNGKKESSKVVNAFMEFNEKLQELRRQKGLTQEELAEQLYVSRTAISKWESGRGFPNIESLKAISKCFAVSLDELLSGEEILAIAEKDHKEKEGTVQDLIFGLLDIGMALLLFLPFFGQKANGVIEEVSLLALAGIQPYLKAAYLVFACTMVALGILTLALQNCRQRLWMRSKGVLSLIISAVGVCFFVIGRQPYAAVFTFAFLIIKAFMLIRRR